MLSLVCRLCPQRMCAELFMRALGRTVTNALIQPRSQQPLPRQLDLPSRLPGLEASSRDADPLPIRQLELVLVTGPWAGAVVWEVHARQRVRAEVVVAVGCVGGIVSLGFSFQYLRSWLVIPLSTCDLYQAESEGAFCCCCWW